MLSEREYKMIIDQLNEYSSKIPTDTKKKLRKKLKEHEYATKLAPFEPLPHTLWFINHTTSEKTLHKLIEFANTATEFIVDTESWSIFNQRNKPVLLQLQMLSSTDPSYICYW